MLGITALAQLALVQIGTFGIGVTPPVVAIVERRACAWAWPC